MSKQKEELPVIEIPASGKPDWYGGAWCLVWVYSTKGNFLLKGFRKECEEYIKSQGWKCWAIYNLYHTKCGFIGHAYNYRTIIDSYNCGFKIYSPSRHRRDKDWKFTITKNEVKSGEDSWKTRISVKRLPKIFVDFNFPEIKVVKAKKIPTNTFADIPGIKELKDKMDEQ